MTYFVELLSIKSWSGLTKAAEKAESHGDYRLAERLWQRAYFVATLTINRRLAEAKANACRNKYIKTRRRKTLV